MLLPARAVFSCLAIYGGPTEQRRAVLHSVCSSQTEYGQRKRTGPPQPPRHKLQRETGEKKNKAHASAATSPGTPVVNGPRGPTLPLAGRLKSVCMHIPLRLPPPSTEKKGETAPWGKVEGQVYSLTSVRRPIKPPDHVYIAAPPILFPGDIAASCSLRSAPTGQQPTPHGSHSQLHARVRQQLYIAAGLPSASQ